MVGNEHPNSILQLLRELWEKIKFHGALLVVIPVPRNYHLDLCSIGLSRVGTDLEMVEWLLRIRNRKN